MIDLHTHSTASDGSYSPSALLEEAAKRGISALALTDHDTVDGLEEARQAALERGIRFIPGVELEIEWNEGEFHLLGLSIRQISANLQTAIKELARRREERNLEIVAMMHKAGITVSYDEIRAIAAGKDLQSGTDNSGFIPESYGSIGRPHFAAFLVRRGIVRNMEHAFDRYLGRGRPFYIPKTGLEFEQAVLAIHESGGLAILAHPMSLYVSWGRLPNLIKNLKDKRLDGLEAWHPSTNVNACKRLEELAKNLGLCVTAGSDFHGEARPDRKMGITAGGKKIDDCFLEALQHILPP